MPVFAYKVRDRAGNVEVGLLQASSEKSALQDLQASGRFVIDLRRQEERWRLAAGSFLAAASLRWSRPVDARDLARFCRQMAALVDAGIPLVAALSMASRRLTPPALKGAAQRISVSVAQGQTLISVLEQQRHVFPELFIRLVEMGEMAGVLDQVLHRLADHYEKESTLMRKIRSALLYPALVLLTAGGSTLFFLFYVIPAYTQLLYSLGVELPAITRFVVTLAGLIQEWGLWLIPLGALGLYGIRRRIRSDLLRIPLEKALFKFPLLGGVIHRAAISRISRSLSILIGSGVPIVQALVIVEKLALYRSLAAAVRRVRSGVGQGHSLHQRMEQSDLFPPEFVHLVYIGEESGALDVLLEKGADYFDADVDGAVTGLTVLLEPALLVLVAGVVGFLALSLLMPLFAAIDRPL
ncbi:hypothetical protein GTO89_09590 [Heliobacterium gestii]|uniref:Type II secretion system protein GspF domain-containing protein n=1 Tax=Heliomicrobium gestii TaxID=2699 RepID=A0A845LEE0_HELGE|nr:type II secretion system F family protein [Heliomicrobium gestii]MBM7867898.1 type IV pilus assembly protein PilC [Heliomicrobium gestii]MZP43290.1 hypothetical protein [Heliomicrobium gestii]